MTREEHIAKLNRFDEETRYSKDNPINTIHIARREFISLLHDFESRTCDNCKWFNGSMSCKYNNMIISNIFHCLPKDFGCNKWESK